MGNWWSANTHWIEQTRDSSGAPTSTSGTLSTWGTSSTQNLTCEVFLSFRGPDTRLGFTSHLHRDLKTHGIDVFIDKENLEEGFEIHPYLKKAIEKSQYAVVIISERFADSKSCLMELSEIMERKRKGWIKVFPIFYHVEPSDVRHQKGMFGKHFARFRKEVGSKVDSAEWEKWTAALKEVGELKGWPVQNREEAQVVQEIRLKIFRNLVTKSIGPLFGIETQVEGIMNLLRLESGGVRFIGICGIGGIGKSTLARVIVERASPEFCATSIVDVGKHGIYKLGKQLVHDLVSPDVAKLLKSEDNVRDMLGSRLIYKKVLIVLDDLDEEKKLEVAKRNCFGEGSRIIITSRDRKWSCLDEDSIYDVKALTGRAALELFCSKAFPKGDLREEFWELVEELVNLAKGLPLALEVYGSHVKGEEKGYWEGYRDDLKKYVDEDVKGHLQITFERLKPRLRDAFLDIVCFFNHSNYGFLDWEDKDRVQEALVGLGHSSNILRDLENKSLLKFFKHDLTIFTQPLFMRTLVRPIVKESLSIHDLLVQIGEGIADQERLWRVQDIISELQENSGKIKIDKLKVFRLRASSINEDKPIKLCLGALSKMKNLRIVDICDDLESLEWCGEYSKLKLSNELRYLLWDKYPFESLPVGFIPTNLMELKLNNSSINQLWNGDKCFLKLKDVDLSSSRALKETPDFSLVPNLETLNLSNCTNLSLIHPSIGLSKQLRELNLGNCLSLEQLPDIITSTSLEVLNLDRCLELKGLPNEIHSKSLKYLDLSSCSKLENLVILGKMPSLQYIYISQDVIKEFPFSFQRLPFLEEFHVKRVPFLEEFCVGRPNIGRILDDIVFFSKKKKVLTVVFDGLYTDVGLPPSTLSSLKCQILHNVILSDEVESNGCSGLLECSHDGHKELLQALFSSLKSLSEVNLINCNLEAIPKSIGYWSVSSLDLSGNKFTELPNSMCKLSNLRYLTLNNCTSLRGLPKLPSSLWSLNLQNCPSLEFESLTHEQIPHPSIRSLNLSKNGFTELPDGLCELYLESLRLDECISLQSLPKLPLRLCDLRLTNCPSLPAHDFHFVVAYIGFDCKPHMILYLQSQDPMYGMPSYYDECGNIVPNVACGPTLRSRIPEWFVNTGSSSNETIQIHMDWNSANDSPDDYDSLDAASDGPDAAHILNGCALLIIYEVYGNEPENSDISACEGSNRIFPEFVCQLQCKEVSSHVTFSIRVPEVARVGSHGVWVFINFGKFELWELEKWSYLISVTASSENVKLKECGARLLQKDSESEFCRVVSNISRPGLDSVSISGALRNYLRVTSRRLIRSPKLLGFCDWICDQWSEDECGFSLCPSSVKRVLIGAPNGIEDPFAGNC